ncbi:uncharacterized protein G2W53_009788 [Senna tora]|uniref:Uncharacterized protein n=1 Tax=Senna tora TaxID=362788 RepID=A0A835C8S3_9FABA|nr:uncharacterized protein G2W53_009788 [Senna tora]
MGVILMLRLESSWNGRSVDHVLTYSERQNAVGSQKPSRIARQKTCCASESNTSVRVVFANRSGFDAPIGVVLAWEERGSCLNIFQTKNRGRISETFTNYEAKDSLHKNLHELRGKRLVAQVSQTSRFANRSGFDAPIGVVLAWEERGSCLNIFRMTNGGWISETFMNYEAKDVLRKSVDHILTYSGRQIAVGSQEPSRITRQRTCCASESNTSVVLMLRLESSPHGRSVDHVSKYSGRQITVGSRKPSRIKRQKTCCASESNTSLRVVFANRCGFDAPIGVVLAWEERGSCINIFPMTNRGPISEKVTNYEAKDLLRNESNTSVLVVFANWSGFDAPIGDVLAWEERGSCINIFRMKNHGQVSETSTNYEAKDLLRNELNTSVRVVFANRSGVDAPIGVVLAWAERGSCLNIFRMTNRGRISDSFTNYEAKDLLRKSVDHVLTYFGRKIAIGSQKPSRITRQKACCASESSTSVRVVFGNESGFDAPIGVVLAWEECGSCLNIFRTTNRGRISETFTNYELKDLLRINLHELRGKRLVAQVSQTRRFANGSGFDAPIGVVLAWEGRGSCLNIFRTTNRDRISETFTNYEAKDLLRKSVDHVSTYSGRQIAAGSQKPSRITRQKTCCASESNTSVRVVFANGSGFDAPIGVVLAWEERGSCLNIFRRQIAVGSQKPSRITRQKTCCASESKTSVRVVIANRSGFDGPIGVVLAWEERGSCLNIFRTTNRGRISETFTNYEAKDLLRKNVDHVSTYSGRQIAVGSQKTSRITRQKTCCASESNTSVRVVFANRSGFDAPIGVVLAKEERGSCLTIFRMTNRDRISETFTNYEAKDLLCNESNTSVHVVFAKQSGFDAPIGVVLAWEERGSCLDIFRTTNRGQIPETFMNYEAKELLRKNLHELRGKRLVVQVSQTRRFANRRGFDAPDGVVLAWEERGSCLNIFQTTNRGRISETFTNYEAKDLLRK